MGDYERPRHGAHKISISATGKKMAVGDIVQRLWETVELQAVHIDKLRQRIEALEATRRKP